MRAKRFIASSFARTLETVVTMVTGLIMMPLMIRVLGENLYGIWIVIGSIVGSLYLFDIGMASTVTRFVSYALSKKDRQRASQVVSTAFAIYSLLALAIFLTSAIIALASSLIVDSPDNKELVQTLILIVGLNVALEFPFKCYAGIAGYHLRQDLLSYSRITFKIISSILIIFLLMQGYQLITLALIQLASSILSNFVFRYIAHYLEPEIKVNLKTVTKKTTKEIFSFSAWSFLIDLSRLLKERGDVWMVAAFTSPALLTVYYVGVRLVEYSNELLYKAFGFTLPLYTDAVARNDTEELHRKIRIFLRVNTLVAGLVLLGAYLFGKDIIRFWMGPEFNRDDAYLAMTIILSAKLLVFISNPYSNVLYAIAKHKYQAFVSASEAALSMLLIPLFIHYMHNPLVAASIAIALPFFFTRTVIIPFIVRKHSGVPLTLLYSNIGKTALPISAFGVLWFFILNSFEASATLFQFLALAITYSITYALFSFTFLLKSDEKALLKKGLGITKQKPTS